MQDEFTKIGRELKAKSGAYQDLPDDVVGQAYLKKTNPLQYEIYKNNVELSKSQQSSDIQAQKELDVNGAKLQQNYAFEQTHPKPLTPTEQATQEDAQSKKDAAIKSKQSALSLVNDLLSRDTGAITGSKNPLKYLTREAQYTTALLDQLKAKLSLESRGLLKGTGTITDIEVKMLEDSIAALAKSPDIKNPKNGKTKSGSYQLRNEDLKKELLRIKEALSGEKQDVDVSENPMSAGEFVQNAGKDAGSILQGILGLPGVVGQAAQETTKQSPLTALLGPGAQLALTPTGKSVGKGIADEYGNLIKNPVQHGYDKPVSTVLDLLPVLKAAKLAKAGKVGQAGEAANVAGKTATLANDTSIGAKIIRGVEKGKSMLPQSIFGQKQGAAAAETLGKVKVDPSRLIKAGERFAETDVDAAARLPKEIDVLNKVKDIPTLLEKMQTWGSKTYGAKGLKGTAKADLYDKFYKEGTQILKETAPEVYKQRQFLRYTFELPQALGKALWRATLGKYIVGS